MTKPADASLTAAATVDELELRVAHLKQELKSLKQALKARRKAEKDRASQKGVKPPRLRTASVEQSRFIEVRDSGVHGKGVFATGPLKKGEVLIEYVGEVLSWKKAQARHPHDPNDPNHTFFFHVDDKHVIDAAVGGNDARWINHACDPNCEADEVDGRVFIKTLKAIKPGSELFYDYGLILDEPYTESLKAEYACRCGSPKCRGTMLAPKDDEAVEDPVDAP